MEVANLNVEPREAKGTNQVRRLRDTGIIPMNLFGGGQDAVSIQANYPEVKRHLEHHLRIYNLKLGDKVQPGYLENVQWDVLTDEPLHVDFQRIEMDKPLDIQVELALLGRPKGETRGSAMIRDTQYLSLSCMPASVPEQVEVRVDDLDASDKLLAGDIKLPEGCTLNMPADQVICHMTEAD